MDKIRGEEDAFDQNSAEMEKGLRGIKMALKVLNDYYTKANEAHSSSGGAGSVKTGKGTVADLQSETLVRRSILRISMSICEHLKFHLKQICCEVRILFSQLCKAEGRGRHPLGRACGAYLRTGWDGQDPW